MSHNLSFIHRFEPGTRPDGPPLLLLHGTGGDESDLLPLGKSISPGSPLLSPRGKVLEGGMPRFFRRLAEGVFDEDDLRRSANDLAEFVEEARKRYGIAAPIALGYSNGANIAAALLLLRPHLLAGAMLLRAMVPLKEAPKAELAGKPILILSGQFDPIIPSSNSSRLAAMLADDGARVQQNTLPVGHGLTQADVDLARKWIHEQAAVLPTEARR
jgi:phospholipase/carboxylesterase